MLSGCRRIADAGHRTGGDQRNRDYLAGHLDSGATPGGEALCFDPQTSGGLLAAVDPGAASELLTAGGWWRVGDWSRASPCSCCGEVALKKPIPKRPIPVIEEERPRASVEREMWERGHEVVVGIDEVGRGAWAGPLMVGAADAAQGHPGQRRARLQAADRT